MLTVILAEREELEKFNKYKLFLKPLLDDKNLTFCEMNPNENTIEDIAPELHKIINNCDSWRAVVLARMEKDKLNPFDFTGYSEKLEFSRKKAVDWDGFSAYLRNRQTCYEKAVENPLMRLTFALGKEHMPVADEALEEYRSVVDDGKPLYKLMMERRLSRMNIPRTVNWIRKYGNSEVDDLFSTDEDFNAFIDVLETGDTDRIIELVGPANVPYFSKHIAEDDPFCSDPYYVVSQLDEISKEKQMDTLRKGFTLFDTKPEEIICIAPRSCDLTYMRLNSKDNIKDFTDFNLYPENADFFLFDLLPENHRQYEQDYIRYLSFVLVMAANEFPKGSIDYGKLYIADAEIDRDRFFEICSRQDAKLAATRREILKTITEKSEFEAEPLDSVEAREIFESNIRIPVEINTDIDKSDLMADHGKVGLSKDCPEDEYSKWVFSFKEIEKKFLRYMREPRRAVKTAAKCDFAANSVIDDERVRRIGEFQREDILFRLQEEEQNMVNTVTVDLYDSDKYIEDLRKESDNIKKTIDSRMTKKATIGVGLGAGAAFIIGFLPLIFSNFNTFKSFGVSALMTLICVALFLLAGIITLFSFRKKLLAAYVAFNSRMNAVFSEIIDGLRGFSDYLSHACNVMRENSVLNAVDEEISEEVRIMKKHILDIDEKREEIRDLYSGYFTIDAGAYKDAEPFDYDFKVLTLYEYEAEFDPTGDNVEFIEHGRYISVPVDYIKSISVDKESINE